MKLPSLELLADAFVAAFRRFPAALSCAVVGSLALMAVVEQENHANEEFLGRIIICAVLGLAFFTGLAAYGESHGWPEKRHFIGIVLGLVALVGYFLWLGRDGDNNPLDDVEGPRFAAWLAVTHLWVAFAPFLGRPYNVADFWEYNKQIFARWLTGGMYTVVLWAGLSGAILAVNELFDLNIQWKIYLHLWFLLAGVFNTAYFLFHYPKDFEFDQSETAYTGIFRNLCKFILIPIVGLYFFILYAYSGKILATWNLPHGWVSSLVIGFAAAGIFTWLLNFQLPKYDSGSIVNRFHKWFWPVLFPMLALLFVAISRRIWDYGVTEERFFVAHAGAWLTLCCVFFVIVKSEDIKFIPLSLAAFILVAMYGPFSAFESTKRSQTHQLKTLFEKNGLLVDGKVKPAAQKIAGEEAERMRNILYLLERKKATTPVEKWFDTPVDSLEGYGFATKIADYLHIGYNTTPDNKKQFSLYAGDRKTGEIAGYQEFFKLELSPARSTDEAQTARHFELDSAGQNLILRNGTAELDRFPLAEPLRKWVAMRQGEDSYINLNEGDNTTLLSGKTQAAKLFVEQADIEQRGDTLGLNSLNGMIFLKKK